MAELTKAMGINAPSLYAAFGSKEGAVPASDAPLLEPEDADTASTLSAAPTARAAIRLLLEHGARSLDPAGSRRMAACSSSATPTPRAERARPQVSLRLAARHPGRFEARMRRGIADGDVPAEADVKAMAAFYMTVLQGLSLRARDDASRDTMLQVVDFAMAAWDSLVASRKPPRSKARKAG